MLMHVDNGRVDHLHRSIMSASQCVHDRGPNASTPPANEAVIAGGVRTKIPRQLSPWRPGTQYPKDAVEDTAVVRSWHATRLIGQHRPNCSSLIVGEFVAHDSSPSSGGLNHSTAVNLNMSCHGPFWSVCTRKQTHYAQCEFCRPLSDISIGAA
jgi:hypothetical protein